jgi:hypothetical protein
MMLTPLAPEALAPALQQVAATLAPGSRQAFAMIAATSPERAAAALADRRRCEALTIAQRFGMGSCPGRPEDGFHWDGVALRELSESYVLVHEVAHFQIAPSPRRRLPEFGLGPGPDTGRRREAEAAQRVFGIDREREEAEASLLGILWEAALGHNALASFLDQNWLEGWQRGAAAAHFDAVLGRLRRAGLVRRSGAPTLLLAETAPRRGVMDVDRQATLEGARPAAAAPRFEPA